MAFLQANLGTIVTLLTGAGLVCGLVGHLLPAGKVQNVLLSLASLLPGNVVGAVKALLGGAS